MKNNADAPFFTQLFVSERKQTTLMADEKSPARISHRRFATKSLRNGELYEAEKKNMWKCSGKNSGKMD